MIINGYNDFMFEYQRTGSYLTAWKKTYKQHELAFDSLIQTVYQLPKQIILSSVRDDEMGCFTQHLQEIQQGDYLQIIKQTLQKCDQFYQQNKPYDTYLLVGLGHIDGSVQWNRKIARPFLYLGWERLEQQSLASLIMHEYNHLVRFQALNLNLTEMSVGDLVIAEGLATLAPLIMNDEPVTEETIQKFLFLSENDYMKLKGNEQEIEEDIVSNFSKKVSREMMESYFMANEEKQVKKSGYYIGVRFIQRKLKLGFSFKTLTRAEMNLFLDDSMLQPI